MRNLWRLIYRYHVFLVFMLLQSIALALLVNNNNYQQASFINSSNSLVGGIFKQRSKISEYLRLQALNDTLAKENALLRSQRSGAFLPLSDAVIIVNDTVHVRRYVHLPAKVVNNSVNRKNNFITIDKGSLTGVQPEMGVVAHGALVGIVKDVSEHFSAVMPIINNNFSASVRIKDQGYFGRLVWEGHDPEVAKVIEIPKHIQLQIGDTVVTTGYSSYFPEDILVGTVKQFEIPEGGNFYKIDIKLSTNFRKLRHIEVIHHLLVDEQRQLEESLESK
jgi:rod shape-determining protein MreC